MKRTLKEDPAYYPADRGNNDDDEPSNDDEDDDDEMMTTGSLPLRNQCKSHHSGPCTVKSLRHYKSECPIVKFQKCVDVIHGRVRASKPKTMQDAIGVATKLWNKKISTLVECQTENKKRLDNTSKNNQNQQ
nr:hypothetical protein [Tanacetum cinerariifolium]